MSLQPEAPVPPQPIPPSVVQPTAANPPPPIDPTAIVALVLSMIFWPAGLVMGFVALSRINASGLGGRGLANAAVIVSTFGAVFVDALAVVALVIAAR